MVISSGPETILRLLWENGYEAYCVGGCVRDSLLGMEPHDWDICTSALPEETEGVFRHLRVVETGLKHGTVTVMFQGQPYEITTFRKDGDYSDHRRPETVDFVKNLREDLARRDFTINAMAAGPDGAVIDLFGGQEDLKRGIIRCVGDPDRRFQEDALRILRAMRFASQLGFSVEKETAEAMVRNRQLLSCVSGERILSELTKLLTGKGAKKILGQFTPVMTAVIPEIEACVGFRQYSPYHNMDVWQHTLEALGKSQPEPMIRWALLLHDLGKPQCFTRDEHGTGHFYGHPHRSEEIAEELFRRLHPSGRMRDTVCTLVAHHDDDRPATEKNARRLVGTFGPELMTLLMEVRRCDILAHQDTPKTRMRYDNHLKMSGLIRQAIEESRCCKISDLEISGEDVLALGIPSGPRVGQLLRQLLDEVLEERCPNQRQALLVRLRELCAER